MNHRITIAGILVVGLVAGGSGTDATTVQDHQQPTAPAALAPDMAAMCQKTMAGMQAGNAQLEELASRMNAATGQAKMAAMAELLTALVKQRTMSSDAMKEMQGRGASPMMEHMMGATTAPTPPPAAAPAPLEIAFRSQPDPPRTGDNTFEVTVKDAQGRPVTDAAVTVGLFMPPMPSMGMPAMRNAATLSHAGGGMYRGAGQVLMAGRWEVTISATRDGKDIGSKQTTITAR